MKTQVNSLKTAVQFLLCCIDIEKKKQKQLDRPIKIEKFLREIF